MGTEAFILELKDLQQEERAECYNLHETSWTDQLVVAAHSTIHTVYDHSFPFAIVNVLLLNLRYFPLPLPNLLSLFLSHTAAMLEKLYIYIIIIIL